MFIVYIQIFSSPNLMGYQSPTIRKLKNQFNDYTVIDIDNFSAKEIVQKLLKHLEVSEKVLFIFEVKDNGPKGIISLILPFILKKKLKTTYCIAGTLMIPPWLKKIDPFITLVNRVDEIKTDYLESS